MIIQKFPAHKTTVNTLIAHLHILESQEGFVPDEIFIDYSGLMKPLSNFTEKRHATDSICTSLRELSIERNIPIWDGCQTNRCISIYSKIITQRGEIEIKDLQDSDLILTHEGFKKILHIFPITKQPVYKIKLKNGKEIIASSKHYFPTLDGSLKSVEDGLFIGNKLFCKK